jgi:acetyltransferase-like isoleucine patch superfamily enzyme
MKIFRVRQYLHYLRKAQWQVCARLQFRRQGVKVGRKISLYGVPIISRCDESTIAIGDRVNLCSLPSFTALGVSRPVILRTLRPGAVLSIGEDSGLSGTTICAARSVAIGKRCLIGADVLITDTDFHPLDPENRRFRSERDARSESVFVGDDVFIGARAIILRGVKIGEGAVVGAGAVVTRDIPAFSVCAGNPARVIRNLEP